MATANTPSQTFLRRALQGNAAFSTLSGVAFILAAKPIGAFLGPVPPRLLILTGICLLGFAAGLVYNANRANVNATLAALAVAGDVMWLLGSGAAMLYANALGLTRGGMWGIAIVADVVLLFAVLQFLGLRRLRAV